MPSPSVQMAIYRLMTSIGELYYLAGLPLLLCLFITTKLYRVTFAQASATATHTGRSESQAATSHVDDGDNAFDFVPAPTDHAAASSSDSELSEPASVSTQSPSQPSPLASRVTIRFLLMNGQTVSHTFPSLSVTVATIIDTLYPNRSQAQRPVRLIYQGRVLESSLTLSDYEITADDIVHVHIASPASNAGHETAASIGGTVGQPEPLLLYFLCMLSAALGVLWAMTLMVDALDEVFTAVTYVLTAVFAFGCLVANAQSRHATARVTDVRVPHSSTVNT